MSTITLPIPAHEPIEVAEPAPKAPFYTTLDPLHVEWLRKARARILAEPDGRLRMSEWVTYEHDADCGTAYCIAGWMIVESKLLPHVNNTAAWAFVKNEFIPGCSNIFSMLESGNPWANLFFHVRWPTRFLGADAGMGRFIAAARIDHWLETGE